MFDDCGYANKWKWELALINGNQTGLVRDMRSWRDTKNSVFVCKGLFVVVFAAAQP